MSGREYLPDGDELRRRRVALGLSQRQVAARLGLKANNGQISQAETGVQSSHRIQQAYAALLDELEKARRRSAPGLSTSGRPTKEVNLMTTVNQPGAGRELHDFAARGLAAQQAVDALTIDPQLMTGGSIEAAGLPSPDAHTVAAHTVTLNTRLEIGRVLAGYHAHKLDGAEAINQILAAVGADAGPAAYTDRLTLHADDLDVPADGPRWQVLDGKDETTWHDLDAVTECEDPNCPIGAALPSDVECIVLVSTAWADGFAHTPADAMVDVRIPAGAR